ncbi:MAG: hypothetical protein ACE1Y4_12805, partial [Lysobacterales bacterium]
VAVSGAGVAAINKIATDVKAYIEGSGIDAGSVALSATDTSVIEADGGAAAVSAAFGFVGVAVSVGVAVAVNQINNDIAAYINNFASPSLIVITRGSGAISVEATDNATITARTAAAAVSAAAGFVGIAVSGSGAAATNLIFTKTNAYVTGSVLDSAGDVTIKAQDTSTINALVISAAASLGGGLVGISGSIGTSIARNLIGWQLDLNVTADYTTAAVRSFIFNGETVKIEEGVRAGDIYEYIGSSPLFPDFANGETVLKLGNQDYANIDLWKQINLVEAPVEVQAYVSNSQIDAAGAMLVEATANETINASVLAGSVAVSAGLIAGASSAAGASVENTVATKVKAFIENTTGTGVNVVGNITLTAQDTSTITVLAGASSVAKAVGLVADSVSIGI